MGTLLLLSSFALATDQERSKQRTQTEATEQEQIFGSQMMTDQERLEYRTKMRAANSAEERAQIRHEHHEHMKTRAQERGLMLPDFPAERGMGGPGMGPGRGMGSGRGMGPGYGRNR